jgi:hypothetical protein
MTRSELWSGLALFVVFAGVGLAIGLRRASLNSTQDRHSDRLVHEARSKSAPKPRIVEAVKPETPPREIAFPLQDLETLMSAVEGAAAVPNSKDLRGHIDALARFLELHPEAAFETLERSLFLDRSEREIEVAALLAAMGQARNPAVIDTALARYRDFSQPVRAVLALSTAQDRGVSTTDSSGSHAYARHFELRDVGEPTIQARLLALAQDGAEGLRGGRTEDGFSSLLMVLALSSHRNGAIDDFLRSLASESGPQRNIALTTYLSHTRSPSALELAIHVFRAGEWDDQTAMAAFSALRRFGMEDGAFAELLDSAYRKADVERKATLLSTLTSYIVPRTGEKARATISNLIREGLTAKEPDIRSAALTLASTCALNWNGWSAVNVNPSVVLRDENLTLASRQSAARSWAMLYLASETNDGEFERLLGDPEVDTTVRRSAWKGLTRTDPKKHRERIKQLAERFIPLETDADLKEYIASLAR